MAGMARPGKAVDAAMLAAAVGVDRAVERQIGRAVVAEGGTRHLGAHFGLYQTVRLLDLPAVIVGRARPRLEPAGLVIHSPTRPQTLALQQIVLLDRHESNIRTFSEQRKGLFQMRLLLSALDWGMS